MLRLTASIDVDIALLGCDVAATKAHARALVKAGLLEPAALEALDGALDDLAREWREGTLRPHPEDEDVHSLVERELTTRLGDVGSRIHAGRSRNDLVAADLRLWCRDAAVDLCRVTGSLIASLADLAEEHTDTLMPGYTHLQRAQPVSLGFHLAAHGFAVARDMTRLQAARAAADVSVLGAGALATSTLGLDPKVAATELGCAGVFANAIDAVSDRDFAVDLTYACTTLAVHLSRLAEEIVLWTSAEFGFASLPDEWSTGSSMMPQKRNPDLAELVRGRSAGAIGDLTSLLTLLKALPLAYGRDLQEDKEVLFRSVARAGDAALAMTRLMAALDFDTARLGEAAAGGGGWATDVAEALVMRGVPFRHAHRAAGRLVAGLEELGIELAEASQELLADCHPLLDLDDRGLADPKSALERRSMPGGPAPSSVREQAQTLKRLVQGMVRELP
jgi:argininosuccinate lyase